MRREIYAKLRDFLDAPGDNRVIMVEGARQVGKSYLVRDVLEHYGKPFISFDLEKDKQFRRLLDKTISFNDFRDMLRDRYDLRDASVLFIDEAQESKILSGYVKSFKEDWPEVRVILTGSSMNRFFSKSERIPVGRTKSLCVFGFSFSEFVRYVKGDELGDFLNSSPTLIEASRHEYLLSLFDDYMYVGGYPESVKAYAENADYVEIIEEIINSLEEDFERKESASPELFRDALQGVANFIGGPSKYTHMKTTSYKAKKIVDAMKSWHLILEVKPQSFNPIHSDFLPKRYLHDLGVVNLMRSQPAPTMSMLKTISPELRTPLGGVFENAALISLLHGKTAKKSIYTWKKDSKTRIEVDFVLDHRETREKIPVECKAAMKLKRKHFANLLQYLRSSGQKTGVIISGAPFETFLFEDDLTIINAPIYLATEKNISAYLLSASPV